MGDVLDFGVVCWFGVPGYYVGGLMDGLQEAAKNVVTQYDRALDEGHTRIPIDLAHAIERLSMQTKGDEKCDDSE